MPVMRPARPHYDTLMQRIRRRSSTTAETRDATHRPSAGAFASPWVQLRSARAHPFIFDRMISASDPAARPGDVVSVYDKSGRIFGRGLFNPRSRIALRMLTFDDTSVDEAFWRTRLAAAVELRRTLGLDRDTDAYRLVHAEGDRLSGLIVERYADCLVFEVFSLGTYQRLDLLSRLLTEQLGAPSRLDQPDRALSSWRIVVRADDRVEAMEGFRVPPPADRTAGRVTIREHGVRYWVDMAGGHKTGFFCDQRDNRLRFARCCAGAAVLDLCCYTGGFGLCAMLAGAAREVTSVDLDEAALSVARENAHLNRVRIEYVHADAFAYLRQMIANGRRFDRVVLDPPKLAATRTDLDAGLRKYHDLNALAVQVVRPGGLLLTCSCSGLVSREAFAEAVFRAARRAGRAVQVLGVGGAAPDHPVAPECPETAYLKAMWLSVT